MPASDFTDDELAAQEGAYDEPAVHTDAPPTCPYGDHSVERKETRNSGAGLWCPTCRVWLTPVEARQVVRAAGDDDRRHRDAHGKPYTYVVPGAPGFRDILIAADLGPALADPLTECLGDGPAAQLLRQLAAAAGGYRGPGAPPMLLLRVERGEDEGDV